jgi:hypothetical protein
MRPRSVLSLLALVTPLLASRSADALDKAACVAASDEGQRLRASSHLLAAREKLIACSDATCPSVVRAACADWLHEVENATPTIVLAVRSRTPTCDAAAAETDRVDVTVSLDGAPFVARLDGGATPIDPGEHVLRFEAQGVEPREERIVVREGEKSRSVRVVLAGRAPECPRASTPPQPNTISRAMEPQRPGPPTGAYVATGVAAVSFAVFGVFAVLGDSLYHDRLHQCGPGCSSDQTAPVNTEFIVADVGLGVGIAAAALATWLFLKPRAPIDVSSAGRGAMLRVAF